MSNVIIPKVYRTVIDHVVASVRLDFDEFAVEEEVLALLQQKWETKLVASRVADFDQIEEPAPYCSNQLPIPPPAPLYHAQNQEDRKSSVLSTSLSQVEGSGQQQANSKKEDVDGWGAGEGGGWNGGLKGGGEVVFEGLALRLRGGAETAKEGEDGKLSITPAIIHPGTSSPDLPDENELNSSLDEEESSDEEEEGRRNMLLCCFEKVSHQKRKWKASLRAGIAHIDGKDWVFDKCQLEVVLV